MVTSILTNEACIGGKQCEQACEAAKTPHWTVQISKLGRECGVHMAGTATTYLLIINYCIAALPVGRRNKKAEKE